MSEYELIDNTLAYVHERAQSYASGFGAPSNTRDSDRPDKLDSTAKTTAQLDAETPTQVAARLAVLDGFKAMILVGYDAISEAKSRVARALERPEKAAEEAAWKAMLRTSLEIVIAGIAGGVGGWVGAYVGGHFLEETVANGVEDAINKIAGAALESSLTVESTSQMATAFVNSIGTTVVNAKSTLAVGWSTMAADLYTLPPQLLHNMTSLRAASATALIPSLEKTMLVEWTNLVAQSVHGRMTWDPWANTSNSVQQPIALKGANRGADKEGYETNKIKRRPHVLGAR